MLTVLLLFTLLLFFAFKACESCMKPSHAFLFSVIITVMIAAGFGMYKVRETFINHKTTFDQLSIAGTVRVRPEDRYGGNINSYTSNFRNGSELTFYDGYKLNGRTYGNVFSNQEY